MMAQKRRKKKRKRSGMSSFETITNQGSKEKGQDQMKSKKLREYLSHKIDLQTKQHLNNRTSVLNQLSLIEAI